MAPCKHKAILRVYRLLICCYAKQVLQYRVQSTVCTHFCLWVAAFNVILYPVFPIRGTRKKRCSLRYCGDKKRAFSYSSPEHGMRQQFERVLVRRVICSQCTYIGGISVASVQRHWVGWRRDEELLVCRNWKSSETLSQLCPAATSNRRLAITDVTPEFDIIKTGAAGC